MNNNYAPFWIRKHLERLNANEVQINFDLYLTRKLSTRNLEDEKITDTIRNGRVILLKSLWPGKIVFEKYFGKENETYIVVTIFMKHHIEVKTAWKRNGR